VKPEDVAFCTVVAKNYLAHARVLVESLGGITELSLLRAVVDAAESWFEPQKEAFQTIRLADLELPHPREFCFRYDVVELSTAVRPSCCAICSSEDMKASFTSIPTFAFTGRRRIWKRWTSGTSSSRPTSARLSSPTSIRGSATSCCAALTTWVFWLFATAPIPINSFGG